MSDDSIRVPVSPGAARVEALIDSGALGALFRPRVETQLELPRARFRFLTEEAAVRVDPRVDWPGFVEELWLAVDAGFNLTHDPRWDFDSAARAFEEVADRLSDAAAECAEERRGGDRPSGGAA